MTAHAPDRIVPDPEPPPVEGSLATFLAMLEEDCDRQDAHPISERREETS